MQNQLSPSPVHFHEFCNFIMQKMIFSVRQDQYSGLEEGYGYIRLFFWSATVISVPLKFHYP